MSSETEANTQTDGLNKSTKHYAVQVDREKQHICQ